VLAIADTPDSACAATRFGLWIPAESTWRRIGWATIVKATWMSTGLEIVEGVDEGGIVTDLAPVLVHLTVPRSVPAVVRARVQASIAATEQVALPNGSGRLVARRIPGSDGVQWTARFDSSTADTVDGRNVLTAYVQQVRQQTDEPD
jgi:hypothetical protein